MISEELKKENEKIKILDEIIDKDEEIKTIWKCQNITAIDRLQMTDHGPTHVKIVAENSLRIIRILKEFGIQTSIEKNYHYSYKDAEVVVYLASILHDSGMSIHREKHEEFSLLVSWNILDRLLRYIYPETEKRTVIKSEILHAIYTHTKDVKPLTLEASIVKLSDGLDMEKGRARIPFKLGAINIHSVSALAIEKVFVEKGNSSKPLKIVVKMKNSAGVFQITELLKRKIKGTPLEKYVRIVAEIEGEHEEKILDSFEI